MDPRSSILDPRSPILDPRNSIPDPRSSIRDPRSAIRHPRSAVRDPRPAIRDPRPQRVQATVGILLLSLIMLDATLALAASGRTAPALLIAALLIPAVVLKRWIPMT